MSAVDEIRDLEERLRQGDLSPEPDTSAVFDELLADDVLFVLPGGNAVGKAAVLQGHRPPRKRTFARVELSDVEIRDLGTVVVVACRTDYALEHRSFAQRAVRVWRKSEGLWKVVVVALMEVAEDLG